MLHFELSKFFFFCKNFVIDKQAMDKSLVELESYPLISRKKLANKMAKNDRYFKFLRES